MSEVSAIEDKLVNIRLHGCLGEALGQEVWDLSVKSVSEAIHAIQTISDGKLYRLLYEGDKKNIKYQVLINKRAFESDEELTPDNLEAIRNSELVCKMGNLENIDIVPILEGANNTGSGNTKGVLGIVLGIILIVVGIVVSGFGGGVLIAAGIGLIAGGIVTLLSSPPKFEDFREIDGSTGRTSYLFNGPQNTTREGGPVPVGYGRLIVGSQVVSAAYNVRHVDAGAIGVPAPDATLGGGQKWFYYINPGGFRVYTDPWNRGTFTETASFISVNQYTHNRVYLDNDADGWFVIALPEGDRGYSISTANNDPPYYELLPITINNNTVDTVVYWMKDRKTRYYYLSFPIPGSEELRWERVVWGSNPPKIIPKSRV